MKISKLFGGVATTAIVSNGYITREAIKRANATLMQHADTTTATRFDDGYSRYRIEQPTARQISEAGSMAMRNAREKFI